jgi:polyhydroxyalkanoate synthesis regulator phasin
MPVTNDPNALRSLLSQKLSNKKLTDAEARAVVKEAVKDGVTAEEAQAIVDELLAAQQSGFDTANVRNERAINKLLGDIDAQQPVPLGDRNGAETLPNGTLNYASLLRAQSMGKAESLSQTSFGGRSLGVNRGGELVVDGAPQKMSLTPPTEALLDGLWSLSKEGQLSSLSDASAKALSSQLAGALEQELAVPAQDPDKFARNAGACAAASALASMAGRWDSATIDKMLALYGTAPTALLQGLILRGLDAAPMDDAQKAKRAALAAPEGLDGLMKGFDTVLGEEARAGWQTVRGPAAELMLSAMAFSKSSEGLDNLLETLKVWDELNGSGIDSEELENLRAVLDNYLQTSDGMGFVFGVLAADAPKERAKILNARVVAQVEPELKADPPKLQDLPLSREQADFVLTLLPNLRDTYSINNMVESMETARGLFGGSSSEPMCAASFELFRRLAADYQDGAAASPDGKLDYSDFASALRTEVGDIQKSLRPRLSELNGSSPKWDGIPLSAEAAGYVKGLLQERLRSGISVDNIGRALKIVADANGGKIEAEGLSQLQGIVDDYVAGWPEMKFFDFNKLERIASAKVEGKSVPLATINGQQVSLGELYEKVGATVAASIDGSRMLHPWQTERWGLRAKGLVELLDVVAEQSVRGEGPAGVLRQQFPDGEITVTATGSDGCDEQFIYEVKHGSTADKFVQASDGTMVPWNGYVDPELFSAKIGADGNLDLSVADKISTSRYPLQNSYGVGDRIDIDYKDTQAVELQQEGKSFSTQWKVLEAEIIGYDGRGNYTVKYKTPAGADETRTVDLNDIRRANNPHYFKPTGSTFSDVTINLNTDADLKAFLEGARPIIEKHLPTDGSLLKLTPQQLARRQKECITDLQRYAEEKVQYPEEGTTVDPASAKFEELTANSWNRIPLGELVKIGRGVCRHQCILEHLLLQYAGIDSRLASGAANTSSNAFRGFHIWTEVTLADNERYLSDQTWSDVAIPLWKGAYSIDKRRIEMYDRTARYDSNITNWDD